VLFVVVKNPFLKEGTQADEGGCAHISNGCGFVIPASKLTWLKIVQNIQGMREGVIAFYKKEGVHSSNLKSPPSIAHSPKETLEPNPPLP
jgi:hypothetical protein